MTIWSNKVALMAISMLQWRVLQCNQLCSSIHRCPNGQTCFEYDTISDKSVTISRQNGIDDLRSVPRKICLNVPRVCEMVRDYWPLLRGRTLSGNFALSEQCASPFRYDGESTSCNGHGDCASATGGISLCCNGQCVHVHNVPCVRTFLEEQNRLCDDLEWNYLYGGKSAPGSNWNTVCIPDKSTSISSSGKKRKKSLKESFPVNYNCFKKTGGIQMAHHHVTQFPKYAHPVHINRHDIPKRFDAREHWPKCKTIREIKDQAECACCWAQAVTGALSDRICINSPQHDVIARLSSQDLLQCCEGCVTCGSGCKGGLTELAYDQYVRNGIVSGGEFGETGTTGGCSPFQYDPSVSDTEQDNIKTPVVCSAQCQPGFPKNYTDDKHYGQGWHMVTHVHLDGSFDIKEAELNAMHEIQRHGPVTCSIDVYQDFHDYTGGVYSHDPDPSSMVGFHSMKIIGWGVDGLEQTPYWLLANTWGTKWGDRGFAKILRGFNTVGIEGRISAGTPKGNNPQVREDFITYFDKIKAAFDTPLEKFYSCDEETGTEYRSSW